MRPDWFSGRLLTEMLLFPTIFRFIVKNKVIFWSFSYLACVVCTIAIIHLGVNE